MGKGFSQFLVLLFLFGFGYVLYNLAHKGVQATYTTLTVNSDSTTTIVGSVASNETGCMTEGGAPECFLGLRVGKDTVFVIYNRTQGFCGNEAAAATGAKIRAGATVKVYGFYQLRENKNTVQTCQSNSYYIKEA
jgi:hypothetical protein